MPPPSLDTFQNLMANELPDFDPSTFALFPDFPMNMDGEFQPQDFVRALESDFIERNWQNPQWDLGGGAGEIMSGITQRYIFQK